MKFPKARIDLIQQVMGASHVFCSAVNDLLDRTLSEVSDEQLAMSQVKLLLLIAQPGQRFKVTDVAEFLGVTNAAASRAIDRLVLRGLVDRTVSREDRRAVDLALTPAGSSLLDRFKEQRNGRLLELMGSVPEEKLQAAVKLLDELSVLLLDLDQDERCLRCGTHFRSGCVVQDVLGRACTIAAQLYDAEHGEEHAEEEPRRVVRLS
jgi:DNA-binding MarR family transcriptional regulator